MKNQENQKNQNNQEVQENNSSKFNRMTSRMLQIKAETASNEEIKDRLLSGGRVTGTNMVVMVCAILIASVGLNTNSIPVIIGAMLVSPLMGSILAIAYGTVSADPDLTRLHSVGFAFQIIFSLIASTIYFILSPVKTPTHELLARTSPSFFDVIIASAGGIAGIVGQTNKEKANNIVPGVAIATALMPPLCTCGYAIANMNLRMLGGAAYLFLINAYFIYASACLFLSLLEIPRVRELTPAEWRRSRMKMVRNTILVLLPCIVLAVTVGLK